jgi:hypothetical protein
MRLTHGDLLEAVETSDYRWDVIFSGFALLHPVGIDINRTFAGVSGFMAPAMSEGRNWPKSGAGVEIVGDDGVDLQ